MTKYLSVFLVLLSLLSGTPLFAKPLLISNSKLQAMGINLKKLLLSNLSYDGTLLTARDPITDFKLKKQGFFHKYHLFYFGPEGLQKTDLLLLPIPNAEQSILDEKGEHLLLEANEGADFYSVDLASKKIQKFFSHVPGQSGFRAEPSIHLVDGAFYFEGYFHNAKGHVLQHGVARLDFDPEEKTVKFSEVFNDDQVRSLLPGVATNWMVMPPDKAMYLVRIPGRTDIVLMVADGHKIRELDHGVVFGGFDARRNRILYALKRESGEHETLVKDFVENKTWKIGGNEPYTYVYLSKNSKTVLLTLMDFAHVLMTTYYGEEKDNFVLKPVPGLEKVPFGTIRLSGDGKHVVFFNKDGLVYTSLP